MDFIVDLPPSEGNTTILTVIDRFSKMAHFVPLKKLPSSEQLAGIFAKEVVRLHGIPQEIVSDRGTQFISRFWRSFCKEMGINLSFSSAYHPQSNGAAERTNQSLEQYLRFFISHQQDNWSSLLPWAELARNNVVHDSSGHTPFFATYGFHPALLPGTPSESPIPALNDHLQLLRQSWTRIQSALQKASLAHKKFADRHIRPGPSYVPGQRVWLSTRHIKLWVPSHKLAPRFIGPYRVLRRINPVSYALDLPKSLRIPNSFHTSLLKPLVCNRYTTPVNQPPPVQVQGQEEYEVQALIDSRWSRGGLQYLVHWKGYCPEERSWVAASDVHAPGLVSAYHRRFPSRPRARHQEGVLSRWPMSREMLHLRPMSGKMLRLRPMSGEMLHLRPMSREMLHLCPMSGEMLRL
uniref:Uncharacterized protein n=1 Tax=Leptobrachium leishanense TaxID=445787 RepID=A0A8C5MLT5_9ANUR